MDDFRDASLSRRTLTTSRRSFLIFWFLGLGWVLLCLALLVFILKLNLSHAELHFQHDAAAVYEDVLQKLQLNEVVLDGLAAHFHALGVPERKHAAQYARETLARYPHIYSLQAQVRVPQESLADFEQRMRAEGFPSFQVRVLDQAADRRRETVYAGRTHFPIVVAEPVSAHPESPLGLDVYSVPHLRTAIEELTATGQLAASQLFELSAGEPAYALFAHAGRSVAQGDKQPKVLVSLVVNLGRLVDTHLAAGMDVDVSQAGSGADGAGHLLHRAGEEAGAIQRRLFPRLSYTRVLETGGQQLALRIDKQLDSSVVSLPVLVVLSSFAVATVLLLIAHARTRQRADAERERAQQVLRESEARYRTLVENAAEAIVVFDVDAERLTDANRNAEKLFGLSREELISREPFSLSPDIQADGRPSRDAGRTKLREALAGDRPIFEWQHRDAAGQPICCEVRLVSMPARHRRLVRGSITDITERKAAEHQLVRAKNYLQALYDASPDMILLFDKQGYFVDVNHNALRECGYAREELIGNNFDILMGQDRTREAALSQVEAVLAGSRPTFEWEARRRDGSEFSVEVRLSTLPSRPDTLAGEAYVLAVVRDITDRRRVQDALHREKERAQTTLQSIGDGVITTDVTGAIDYINPVATQLLGCSNSSTRGRPLAEVFRVVDEQSREPLSDPVEHCLKRNELITRTEHGLLTRADGREFAVNLTVAPIRALDGTVSGAVLAIHDVTKMRDITRQLSYQAAHDSLTGLINRREFELRLDHALQSSRSENRSHALCFMDLDQFKVVNDTCGHAAGDELLAQVAEVLKARLRGSDTLARLGGDEFGVLLESCPPSKAVQLAESLRRVVEDFRFCWEDKRFAIGVSMGLVPITRNMGNLTDVLSAADAACYMAKDLGRNRVYVSRPGDAALAQHHGEMQWVQRIRQALEDNCFELYCQRIQAVHGPDAGIPHFEVLLRLSGEDEQLVTPSAFLPAAERYHLMPFVDRWVVKQAFRALTRAQRRGHDITLSINLSGQSLGDDRFLEFVLKQLRRRKINPRNICFEITETAAIAHLGSAMHFIGQLRELGCKFALDDFGSGLSSFAYLKNMPVDYLKIDGNFVRDITQDVTDRAMVGSITEIGHVMGIYTIAEFAETLEVVHMLKDLDVDYAQGFGIGKPFPLAECMSQLGRRPKTTVPLQTQLIA